MTGARHTINANEQSILVDFSPDAKLDECLNVLSIWLWHVRDGSYPTTVVPRYERMSIRRAPFISTDAPPHFRVSSTVYFLNQVSSSHEGPGLVMHLHIFLYWLVHRPSAVTNKRIGRSICRYNGCCRFFAILVSAEVVQRGLGFVV